MPGDIVSIESGDRIPADLRLIHADNLYIEESALTGESVPVSKTDQSSRAGRYPGRSEKHGLPRDNDVRGTGIGVVVATGMKTEMGKIAHLIQTTETMQTPLQNRSGTAGESFDHRLPFS